MALITCPDCGRQVSDAAAACPQCARPLMRPLAPMARPTPSGGGFPIWLIVILVAVGGIVLIIGTLAVLGIAGMRKYIAAAKTAEARNSLGQIGKDAATAYELEPVVGRRSLCATASTSVPATLSSVSGKKYQSAPSEWTVDATANAGFACLKYEMDAPQYYMYSYKLAGSGSADGDQFVGTANGDLNGDGVASTFSVNGRIQAGGVLYIAPALTELNPDE